MSSNQNLWLDQLEKMGGQFWPPEKDEESDMPEVGARFPMMLYNGGLECIVHDEEEFKEAKKHGFDLLPGAVRTAPKPATTGGDDNAVDTGGGKGKDKEGEHAKEEGGVGKSGKSDPGTHRK